MTQTNPFTPQSGLPPKIFSGRQAEIDGFAHSLDKMRDEQLEHILVLGEWGIGKTSLLRQFKKTSQDKGFWSCFCGVNRVDPKENISARLGLIVDEIILGLPVSEERIESLRRKFNFKTKSASSVQLEFARFLLEAWKEMRASLSCIFLDDVQNFLPRFEVIDILRATLSREDIMKQTRFVFILSSTFQGWDYFLNKHDPIGRFFRKKIM
ncbi:MAG: ATP-binding protein, partial [Candidatus Omnitrophica bacterium]|nr:ATP-binding protein [Candidatus Omnitrophota bacterium]